MVKLRLKRAGKKKAPFYRIVAIDSRAKRDGEYIELIGTYNPLTGERNIKSDVALKWLSNGAQPTDTVRNLLSKDSIMKQYHESKQAANSAKPKKEAKPKKPAAKKPAAKKEETPSE